jgi:hypothetical protein
LVRQITSIVVLSAADDAESPIELVPDRALAELARKLALAWDSVVVGRQPPAIWTWEPLIDAGVISLAGMVAVVELEIEDDAAEKRALRTLLRSWLNETGWGVRVQILWANQTITFVEEILEPGISEEMERYGSEVQVG